MDFFSALGTLGWSISRSQEFTDISDIRDEIRETNELLRAIATANGINVENIKQAVNVMPNRKTKLSRRSFFGLASDEEFVKHALEYENRK